MSETLPGSFLSALSDLAEWLSREHIPAVIVGGVAASILGRPRLTQDIDALALLPDAEWARALDSATACGIVPRIPEALAFATRSRVLLVSRCRP